MLDDKIAATRYWREKQSFSDYDLKIDKTPANGGFSPSVCGCRPPNASII
jgi:hypothetical protein